MTLPELIAELERAEEGSRELSDKVLLAAGWQRLTKGAAKQPGDTGWRMPDGAPLYSTHPHLFGAPDPTRSLDAALTLVPEGWIWRCDGGSGSGFAVIGKPTAKGNFGLPHKYCAGAMTPALALCIASLRAREEE